MFYKTGFPNINFLIVCSLVFIVNPIAEEVYSAENNTQIRFNRKSKDVVNIRDSTWIMHLMDPDPPSGADGAKFADVNNDGLPDLVSGFEEGGVSRIYIHPGLKKSKNYWEYIELPSPDVEDAVLVDLDCDGKLDLVTASEGQTNQIMFHWAPDSTNDYMESEKWTTQVVPVTDGMSAWMFVVPMDMDSQNGIDLLIGSKRKIGVKEDDKAIVGWLRSPKNPRNINDWEFFPLTTAGWVMSIEVRDMNGDHRPDILLSDRRSSTRKGVRWLENPGKGNAEFYMPWKSHLIGEDLEEPMFHISADLNGDGKKEIVVPDLYRGLVILQQNNVDPTKLWSENIIPYPTWAGPRGKAVASGDLNLDGNVNLVLSFEEEGKVASIPFEEYKTQGKFSVIWGISKGDPIKGNWEFQKISGLKGRKFDLVNLVDMDGDGDLDVVTTDENEEGDGLGVVWYENPIR